MSNIITNPFISLFVAKYFVENTQRICKILPLNFRLPYYKLIDRISVNKRRQLQLGLDSQSINMLFDICQKGASSFLSQRYINSIVYFILHNVYFPRLGID